MFYNLKNKYVNRASTAMRGALKEPAKKKALAQETYTYKVATWEKGVQSSKTLVSSSSAP